MEKYFDWFNAPNKKEAIRTELFETINSMLSDEIIYMITSPEIGVLLEELDNIVISKIHEAFLDIRHTYNYYTTQTNYIPIYLDRNSGIIDQIKFMRIDLMGRNIMEKTIKINLGDLPKLTDEGLNKIIDGYAK